MCVKNIFKYIAASFLLFLCVPVFSESKYEMLFKTGTVKEIKKQFMAHSNLYRMRVNSDKDTILMSALRYNRDKSVINLIFLSGTSFSWKNKNGDDAMAYALRYSTDEKVLNLILKKCGSKKAVTKKLFTKYKSGKLCWEYASVNPIAMEIIKPYFPEEQEEQILTAEEEKTEEPEQEETPAAEENVIETAPAPQKEAEQVPSVKEQEPVPVVLAITSKEPSSEKEETVQVTVVPEAEEKTENIPVEAPEIARVESVYLYDFLPPENKRLPDDSDSQALIHIEDPDETDSFGRTALMNAAKSGNLWLLKSLINSGADIKLKDKEGWSALMYGIRYQNNIEVINLLVQNGALLNDKNNYGTSTLSMASCWSENPEILKKVLNAYKPGDQEIFRSFILCITSENTSILTQCEKLDIFIKRKTPINRIHEGKTPLMYACQFGKSTRIIDKLLKNGAVTTIRTAENKTAFDFAAMNKKLDHDEIYWSLNTGR